MLGAIIGAATSAAGALLGNSMGRSNAAEQHDWAKEDAQISRDWQERMSNSAHQREVEDLRKAGLNPILSATGGAGAPVGGGAMASSEAAEAPDFEGVVSNALEAMKASPQNKLLKAQEELASTAADVNKATEDKIKKETDILGPKSFIFDKMEEMLKNGTKAIFGEDKNHPPRWQMKNPNPKIGPGIGGIK